MQVVILEPAEKDLEDGFFFYERQASGLGSYFLDSLYADIDALIFFGGIHNMMVLGYHRLLSKRFPFAVYYSIEEEIVLVRAVLDCRQHPNWIRERLMGE